MVNLRESGFGGAEWVVAAVLVRESIVVFVKFEHAFKFVMRGCFPLPQNGLLNLGVEAKLASAIVDALDSRRVDIDA